LFLPASTNSEPCDPAALLHAPCVKSLVNQSVLETLSNLILNDKLYEGQTISKTVEAQIRLDTIFSIVTQLV
jgi:hypothetical protein